MTDLEKQEDIYATLQHKKRAFLVAYSECGNITQAAEAADISRQAHYNWLKEDPDYAVAFVYADEAAGDNLEAEARRRAVEGVEEPVFYQGEVVGTIRKYSDPLLIFLLKGAKPEKYKDRVANEHSGRMALDVDIERMTDDELLNSIKETTEAIADIQTRIGTPGK